MQGTVCIRQGDMFDGPSDLIIIPCATSGDITRFVADRLARFSIPKPPRAKELGHIEFKKFSGAENIAQYVGFAYSVYNMQSHTNAILNIARKIGLFCREESSVSSISTPLLGAGAGGLEPEEVINSLSKGFLETAPHNAKLTIHVLDQFEFRNQEKKFFRPRDPKSNEIQSNNIIPRVFISYSGTSDIHASWVCDLAKFLRQSGINARLDLWHLKVGMDLPQWMSNEITLADKIIIISDKRYADRANGRLGGVGWETKLIQYEMMNTPPGSSKYMAVIRDDNPSEATPHYLKSNFNLIWNNKQEAAMRNRLLKEILEIDTAPPISERLEFYIS